MLFAGLIAFQEGFSKPPPLIALNRGCALASINLTWYSDSPLDDNPTLIKIVKNCFFTSKRARLVWLPSKSSIFVLTLGLKKRQKKQSQSKEQFQGNSAQGAQVLPFPYLPRGLDVSWVLQAPWLGTLTHPTEDMEEGSMEAGKQNASLFFSHQSCPKQYCLLPLGLLSALGFVASSVLKCPAYNVCFWQKSGGMRGLSVLQLFQYKVLCKR